MKKLFFLFAFFPCFAFSQSIAGIWVKDKNDTEGIEFTKDGITQPIDLKTRKSGLHNISIKYSVSDSAAMHFMKYELYDRSGTLREIKKFRYKISNDTLYMPKFTESNGVEKIKEFRDIWIRYK